MAFTPLLQDLLQAVLGVNLGKLGFLAEIDIDELPPALSSIDNHDYTVEPRRPRLSSGLVEQQRLFQMLRRG